MKNKYLLLASVLTAHYSAHAALAPYASLSIEAGSQFGMDAGFWVYTSITGYNGLNVGTVQPAPGSHKRQPEHRR